MDEKQERTLAMFCHLGALGGYLIPLGNVIVPLVIWLSKKNESALVDKEGKESLNFQISIVIYAIIAFILTVILIGVFLLIAIGIFNLVMIIMASIKISSGEEFKYPLAIRFIK